VEVVLPLRLVQTVDIFSSDQLGKKTTHRSPNSYRLLGVATTKINHIYNLSSIKNYANGFAQIKLKKLEKRKTGEG